MNYIKGARVRLSPGRLLILAISVSLSSCAVFNAGAPVASMKVAAASGSDVETAVIEAFIGHGFRYSHTDGNTVTLQRAAGRMDEVLYGNWNEWKALERVVVRMTEAKPGFYRISCIPYAVRGSGTGMEDTQRRVQTFSLEYSSILREVRRKLAETPKSPGL